MVHYILLSWLLYDPCKTSSTNLPLVKSLPTEQNSWVCSKTQRSNNFINYCQTSSTNLPLTKSLPTEQNIWVCSKTRRKNHFINYPHFALTSILHQLKLLLFLFSSYPISHFASPSTIATSGCQLVEMETWASHSFTVLVSNINLRPHVIVADCSACSSSQHRVHYHNHCYFDCLCRAMAYEGRHRRDKSRSHYSSLVHTALNSRSFLVGWRFFSPYAHPSQRITSR